MKIKYLISLLIITVSYPQEQNKFENIFTSIDVYPHLGTDAQWFNNGSSFSYLEGDQDGSGSSIYSYNTSSGEHKILLGTKELQDASGIKDFKIDNYKWSPGNNYILFTGKAPARSLKTAGDFWIYDTRSKKMILHVASAKEQLNIKFSPDESKIGFVRDNNLYVADILTGKQTPLTYDGSNTILNGVFDWVYEEEFSIIEAWCWSPDSKKIAFWRLDQSQVPQFPITEYDSLYNQITMQRYPKVGAPVSAPKIGVADIESGKITWMDLGKEEDFYIPRMCFTNDPDLVAIQKLNRLQNKLELLFADANTGESETVITEEDEQWVDVWDHITFLQLSRRFIWSSERDGFLHLFLYDYDGKLITQLTNGEFEVDKLVFVDELNSVIYFTSNERSPLNKDLYSVSLSGQGKARITEERGTHIINFSPNSRYFIDEFSSAAEPSRYYLKENNGTVLNIIYEPDDSLVRMYASLPVEFFKFSTSDGVELNAFMMKPKDFDPGKKYPVIIFNYSGPGSQSVQDSWYAFSYNLYQYFAMEGYIVFTVDNRGTAGRGKDFKDIVYKNLGRWELNDIIEGLNYLNRQGFIDNSRVGITGSSYGGFIAALAVLKYPELFKTAIAVSSVFDWRFYDAIYSERYMQTEGLNPDGYTESSVLNYAERLAGKLLIIHGTSDDNVHFQNSAALVDKLVKNNQKFDLMIYPGTKHGPFRVHYYYLLRDYILKNL